jgi:hypothetical protein
VAVGLDTGLGAGVDVLPVLAAPFVWPPAVGATLEFEREPPPTPLRYAYGGTHCGGSGAGGSHEFTTPPSPSTTMAGAAQLLTVAGAAHVHAVDGHWAGVVQGMTSSWQDDVDSVVVVQVGGGVAPPSSVPTFAGMNVAVDDPVVEPPAPPDAEPLHSVAVSGTQVKPEPQSESTLQGRSYWGTHDLELIVVHAPASNTGTAQSAFGGHAGVPTTGQLSTESV